MLPHTYDADEPSTGIRHDTLVDARMEVGSAKAQLKDVYVTMDSLADDREGIWTEDERQEIRLIQKTAKALVESCGENIDDIQDELDAVEEEMQS